MAEIFQNEFTTYTFKDGELAQATQFTELNLQFIRTIRGRAAIEKANLGFADIHDTAPILRSEYLRGLMAGLDVLLQEHSSYNEERLQNLEISMAGQGNFSNEIPRVDISKLFEDPNEQNSNSNEG